MVNNWLCVLHLMLNLQQGNSDLEFIVTKFNKVFRDSPHSTTLKSHDLLRESGNFVFSPRSSPSSSDEYIKNWYQ